MNILDYLKKIRIKSVEDIVEDSTTTTIASDETGNLYVNGKLMQDLCKTENSEAATMCTCKDCPILKTCYIEKLFKEASCNKFPSLCSRKRILIGVDLDAKENPRELVDADRICII